MEIKEMFLSTNNTPFVIHEKKNYVSIITMQGYVIQHNAICFSLRGFSIVTGRGCSRMVNTY